MSLESLRSLGVVLGGLAALAYLLLPLLIKATFRQKAKPTLVPIDPSEGMPGDAAKYFYDAHEQMTALGFENLGTYQLPDYLSNVRGLLIGFIHRETRDMALTAALYAKNGDNWKLQARFTEIGTDFADASTISTGNLPGPGAFPKKPTDLALILPHLTKLADLYRAHQAILRSHSRGRRSVMKLDDQYGGRIDEYLVDALTSESETAAMFGYLKRTPGKASESSVISRSSATMDPYRPPAVPDVDAYFTPTWKGAYLMTWQELFPVKQIRRIVRLRHDRGLLAQTDYRGSV